MWFASKGPMHEVHQEMHEVQEMPSPALQDLNEFPLPFDFIFLSSYLCLFA